MTDAQAQQMIDLLTKIEANTGATQNLLVQVFARPEWWQPSLLAIAVGVTFLVAWRVFHS